MQSILCIGGNVMERNEVLKKAGEDKFTDEREHEILLKSYQFTDIAFAIIMIPFVILEFLYFQHSFITSSLFIVKFFCIAVRSWYSAICIKRRKLLYVEAIIATIAFIILAVLFVINVHHKFLIKGTYL